MDFVKNLHEIFFFMCVLYYMEALHITEKIQWDRMCHKSFISTVSQSEK